MELTEEQKEELEKKKQERKAKNSIFRLRLQQMLDRVNEQKATSDKIREKEEAIRLEKERKLAEQKLAMEA